MKNFLYSLCRAYFNKPQKDIQDFLGITAIIKNEAPYIREWIEFHKLQGVTKFFIYDNESSDDIRKILEPYIKNGEVILKYIKGRGVQAKAYNDSLNKNRNKVLYMAFIDIDEFITPIKDDTVVQYLKEFERRHKKFDALCINWLIHGFNGHFHKKDGLIIENYKKCDRREERNNHVKTLLNPRSAIMTYHPHFFIYKAGAVILNTKGEKMYGPFNPPLYDEILINHYYTKSFEEYKERLKKGKADLSKPALIDWAPNALSYDNDNSVEKFIQPLKEKLSIDPTEAQS